MEERSKVVSSLLFCVNIFFSFAFQKEIHDQVTEVPEIKL